MIKLESISIYAVQLQESQYPKPKVDGQPTFCSSRREESYSIEVMLNFNNRVHQNNNNKVFI